MVSHASAALPSIGEPPMTRRRTPRFLPGVEPLESKQVPSAGGTGAVASGEAKAVQAAAKAGQARTQKPNFGYLVYRVTNPKDAPVYTLKPPFGHVMVQSKQPVTGKTYNILFMTLKNNTDITFDANSKFFVAAPGQTGFIPILKGDETWKPGQDYIFYIISKKYYPMPNPASSGFVFRLDGARSVAIPGPSGIFLRIKYSPDTINNILDKVATKGPGVQGGKGIAFGLPVTSLYAFVSSKVDRNDFGGYF